MAAAPPPGFGKETFFEPTRIWLFGKKFTSLTYNRAEMDTEFSSYKMPAVANPPPDLPMPPKRIERTLRRQQTIAPTDPIFARIYSFSFEGHYYKLARPLLFLVTGDGISPQTNGAGKANPDFFNTYETGIEAKEWNFSDDLLAWKVDRKDMAICLDIEVGNYQEILLSSASAGRGGAGAGAASRGDMTGRGDMIGRGSFRGDMIGPHQN